METLFIGRNLIFLSQVDSTNSYATEMLKNVNLIEGTVIQAEEQTHGKGQRGSVWKTEKTRNLTASIIIKPTFLALKNQHYLYQISALACYDVLSELLDSSQFDIKIKWPNDILVNKQKIAGILIENNVIKTNINWSIIGIGLNVNQTIFNQEFNATSLSLLLNKNVDINEVLKLMCNHFEKYYLLLKNKHLDQIKEKYSKHFFGLNTYADFEINNAIENLLIKGIDENGLLQLENKDGKQNSFDVKELKWIY